MFKDELYKLKDEIDSLYDIFYADGIGQIDYILTFKYRIISIDIFKPFIDLMNKYHKIYYVEYPNKILIKSVKPFHTLTNDVRINKRYNKETG